MIGNLIKQKMQGYLKQAGLYGDLRRIFMHATFYMRESTLSQKHDIPSHAEVTKQVTVTADKFATVLSPVITSRMASKVAQEMGAIFESALRHTDPRNINTMQVAETFYIVSGISCEETSIDLKRYLGLMSTNSIPAFTEALTIIEAFADKITKGVIKLHPNYFS